MKPLNLVTVFDQELTAGGGYQQALNALMHVRNIEGLDVKNQVVTNHINNIDLLAQHGIEADYIKLSTFEKIKLELFRYCRYQKIFLRLKKLLGDNPVQKLFKSYHTDLVYFTSPCDWASDLEDINFLVTVWDVSHRDDPEFPEVRAFRAAQARDSYYSEVLPRAVATLVDSELSKKNITRFYGLHDSRVVVMPFEGARSTREVKGYQNLKLPPDINVDFPYVFYPAQFWAHKNHIYILEGLKILEERFNTKVGVIFAGGDRETLCHVKARATQLSLMDRARFLGFVPDDLIPRLYANALALVMPSYFGPTNLPPLEAFALGIPVLYADTEGGREQLGDAAIFLNLNDPADLSRAIKNLVDCEVTRDRLVSNGYARLSLINSLDRSELLGEIFKNFLRRRQTWA